MKVKRKTRGLSEKEIDKIVVSQADDDSAWERSIRVRKTKTDLVSIPSELSARAAFFARLHRDTSVEGWLRRIIQERIDLEEAAFARLKRDLAVKNSV